jgi:ribosomal protein S18 acetylase RimI-like enzyme
MRLTTVYATVEHLDLLIPLFDAYRQFYGQDPDPEGSRLYLMDRLIMQEAVVLLALDHNNSLAAGFALLYPSYSSISLKRVWILHDLYVAPYARRQGVAQALMEQALQHAEETGAKELQLATATDNAPAKALYEKLGYLRDEDFHHYFLTVVTEAEEA